MSKRCIACEGLTKDGPCEEHGFPVADDNGDELGFGWNGAKLMSPKPSTPKLGAGDACQTCGKGGSDGGACSDGYHIVAAYEELRNTRTELKFWAEEATGWAARHDKDVTALRAANAALTTEVAEWKDVAGREAMARIEADREAAELRERLGEATAIVIRVHGPFMDWHTNCDACAFLAVGAK